MSVNLWCPKCKKTYKLSTKKCNCGNNLNTNRRFKVRLKLPSGRWKSKTVDTLDLAKKVEAKFKIEVVEQDVFNIHKAPLMESAWDKYISWAKLNKKSWKDDRSLWEHHISEYLKGLKMDMIAPHHIQTIINSMYTKKKENGKPYQPATIKHILVLIKHIFNWSTKQGYYHGNNPCNAIEPPKFDNRVTNPLNSDGLRSLMSVLDTWPNERAILMIKFALYTGKRRGEILKLTWGNIDFKNSLLTL